MNNIRTKLLVPTLLMIVFSIFGICYVSLTHYLSFEKQEEIEIDKHLNTLRTILSEQQQRNRELIHLLTNKWHFIDSVKIGNIDAILTEIIPYHAQMYYGLINVYDMNGKIMANAAAPGVFGRVDELSPLVLAMKNGQQTRLAAAIYNGQLILLSLKRLEGTYGPIGVMVVGKYLNQKMVDDFARLHRVNLKLSYDGKEVVSSKRTKEVTATMKQHEILINFSDEIIGISPMKGLLIVDHSTVEKDFWSNLYLVIVVISLVSAVVIIISRRTVMSAANDLGNARASAEKKSEDLGAANKQLAQEITERKRAEEALLKAQEELETRVEERTAELAETNVRLKEEIAEKKLTEEALRKSSQMLSFHVQNTPLAVIEFDLNGLVKEWNLSAEKIFGYSRDEAIGRPFIDLVAPKNAREQVAKVWQNLLNLSGGSRNTNENITKDRRTIICEWFNTPLLDESSKVIGVASMAEDITERIKLEDQLRQSQKMEAIGLLAGGIAHDFNNILTTIIGYGNLLDIQMKEGVPVKSYLKQILASAERATHLTQSLLAFSRKQPIDMRPSNLNEIIKRTENFLCRLIGEDVELRTVLTDANPFIVADGGQIEQVLMNLATNARDAMPNGGILTIETEVIKVDEAFQRIHLFERPGMYALISVTDTGIGMDEKTKEKIFEPFFTTKEVGKGTGLGLSIAYGIIKQHNGNISIYSEPGRGSTFKIYIPLIASKAEETLKKVLLQPQGGTETVLLVEDDERVRELIGIILKEAGYRVIEAVDGEDAMAKYADNRDAIQILVSDVIIPKMNGKEVYENIKKTNPELKALFISGYTADIVHKKGILEEGLHFISKPILPDVLLRKIRDILDN